MGFLNDTGHSLPFWGNKGSKIWSKPSRVIGLVDVGDSQSFADELPFVACEHSNRISIKAVESMRHKTMKRLDIE